MNDVLLMARLIGVVLCIIGMVCVVVLFKIGRLEENMDKLTFVMLAYLPKETLQKLAEAGAIPFPTREEEAEDE